jgi:hypothetical protein
MEVLVNENEINLLISDKYVKHWELWTGIRETVQNLRDACVQAAKIKGMSSSDIFIERKYKILENTKFLERLTYNITINNCKTVLGFIEYDCDQEKVVFLNEGEFPIGGLSLGGTIKSDDSDLIGKFGEGLKLAALVMVRNEKPYCVETGRNQYIFMIKKDMQLTQLNCLFVKIKYLQNNLENQTKILLKNISINEWVNFCKNILFMTNESFEKVETFSEENKNIGAILVSDNMRQKVFIKGLYVKTEDKGASRHLPNFGYDFYNLELDRDRRSIPEANTRNENSTKIICDIANNYNRLPVEQQIILDGRENDFFEKLFKMLHEGNDWVYYSNSYLWKKDHQNKSFARDSLYKIFRKLNPNKYPIYSSYYSLNERLAKEKKIFGLEDSFYSPICMGWLLTPVLQGSSLFESFDDKILRILKNSPNVECQGNESLIIAIDKISIYFPNIIQFRFELKNFPITYRYIDRNSKIIYLSYLIMNDENLNGKFTSNENPKAAYVFTHLFELLDLPSSLLIEKPLII